jgi:membrane-bound lytic murein transglycosylase D
MIRNRWTGLAAVMAVLGAGGCVRSRPPAPVVPALAVAHEPANGGAPKPAAEGPGGADASRVPHDPPVAVADTTAPSAGPTGSTEPPARAVTAPAADSVTEAPPITWDLDVEANAGRSRVAYFVDVFSGRAKAPFEVALSRQTRYSGIIGDRLKAAGLPQDLTYLALIESWYNPHAYSKAAAVGMWQFMTGTARGVGLRVDWWIDERRDPVRATDGAARLLLSLHDDFGSFFLAAAAYNGGSGRVSRGLTQFATRIDPYEGEDRYFALSDTRYLRPETRDYVPKMIAAALVAKQADRYGLRVDTLAPFAYDSVMAPGGAPLAAIAAAAVTDVPTISDLNPSILRGMLPVGDSLWVRVPPGAGTAFSSRYAELDSAATTAWRTVTSKKGESMASIARKHGLTAKKLGWYNPSVARLKSGNLVPGQAIRVPSLEVANAALDVPNPAIERYPRRSRRPVTRAAAGAAKSSISTPSKAPANGVKAPSKAPAKPTAKAPAAKPSAGRTTKRP